MATLVSNGKRPIPIIVQSDAFEQSFPDKTEIDHGKLTVPEKASANGPVHSKADRGKALRQVIAAFIANLGTINTGLVFGFSAVVVPQLRSPDSIIQIDESQASWIGECLLSAVHRSPDHVLLLSMENVI